MIYFYHYLLELPILIKWDTGIHLDCFNSLLKSFWMAQNPSVKDVFVILRLKQIMWMNLWKEFVMWAIIECRTKRCWYENKSSFSNSCSFCRKTVTWIYWIVLWKGIIGRFSVQVGTWFAHNYFFVRMESVKQRSDWDESSSRRKSE